jgi:hypothetical protein
MAARIERSDTFVRHLGMHNDQHMCQITGSAVEILYVR